jgi:hypothetical protein
MSLRNANPSEAILPNDRAEITGRLAWDLNTLLNHLSRELFFRMGYEDLIQKTKQDNAGCDVAELIIHIMNKEGRAGFRRLYLVLMDKNEVQSLALIDKSTVAHLFAEPNMKPNTEVLPDLITPPIMFEGELTTEQKKILFSLSGNQLKKSSSETFYFHAPEELNFQLDSDSPSFNEFHALLNHKKILIVQGDESEIFVQVRKQFKPILVLTW